MNRIKVVVFGAISLLWLSVVVAPAVASFAWHWLRSEDKDLFNPPPHPKSVAQRALAFVRESMHDAGNPDFSTPEGAELVKAAVQASCVAYAVLYPDSNETATP